MIGQISLDADINAAISSQQSPNQEGGTCYANAVATVLRLAMARIKFRKGGVPEFNELREAIIKEYGWNGAFIKDVLTTYCPKYRLQFQEVDEAGARKAIMQRRPVVATFHLYSEQWEKFKKFFVTHKKGILTADDIKMTLPPFKLCGHAVVLIACELEHLRFMNSWGDTWADCGFFRVKDGQVLQMKFFDVFWTLDDLEECEKKEYEAYTIEQAKAALKYLPTGLQTLGYQCPKCGKYSKANEYSGHLLKAVCPICFQTFKPNAVGLLQSLYNANAN
ncbi:hypothetical protein RFI_06517 [Reticulomyxa filosa]|uniref:Peptidase C1A papain C-terminal domain-containing protein n=1 Tax=Reticulomyxa filosa TaxID=46433 RepID=X6NZ94_RETFI|nr:hypothetical protein RFI_06517 [Reticulomyxa filosa]|eukprot:ETO30602.1 hypothetical protein RFI_06517 [Reticulomyxa filosa]